MPSIESLLHRRSDLSTFLVHFCRAGNQRTARDNLVNIASELTVRAPQPYGMAAPLEQYLSGGSASQKVVCFTETPLEHAWMMVAQIDQRQLRFEPYGVVFTKTTARRRGCNPVWYLDITPGHDWLTQPVNRLVEQAVALATTPTGVDGAVLANQEVFKLTPFIEQMGPTAQARKEFWWEREWRHLGDFIFRPSRVVALLAPEHEHGALRNELLALGNGWERDRPLLDPQWGLERMIAELSGIDPDEIGPLPQGGYRV